MRLFTQSDGAPLDGEQVLAVAITWADRPISLEHLTPGTQGTLLEGVGLSWEGAVPVFAVREGAARVCDPAGKARDVGARCALEVGQRLEVHSGALRLEARLQRRAAKLQPRRSGEGLFAFLVGAHVVMVAIALVTALVITPQIGGDSMWGRATAHRVLATPVVPLPQAKPELAERVDEVVARDAAVTHSPQTPSRPVKRKARDVLARLFGGGGGGVFGGGGGHSAVNEALDAVGPGDAAASAGPLSGLGSRELGGGGPGGPGLSLGRLGAERGAPPGPALKRKPEDVVCHHCAPTLSDDYSRELVMRVIKRHQSEIRFCYETELKRSPELEGKVTVRWSIDGSGNVTDALIAESGLGSDPVEACILQRVKRWSFPEPKSGNEVVITFPWVFRLAGN